MLAPLVGNGLLLSEGAAWRHQRRTIAPLLAPRSMPVLTGPRGDGRGRVPGPRGRPREVDLLPEMQRTALEIAGRSMFSLEMAGLGGPMRAC